MVAVRQELIEVGTELDARPPPYGRPAVLLPPWLAGWSYVRSARQLGCFNWLASLYFFTLLGGVFCLLSSKTSFSGWWLHAVSV